MKIKRKIELPNLNIKALLILNIIEISDIAFYLNLYRKQNIIFNINLYKIDKELEE